MKMLFDFFPVLLFFVAYKAYDFYLATIVIIAATCLQVFYRYLHYKKIEPQYLITLVMIVGLGGATLFLQDEIYLKWKVSFVNWVLAIILLGSNFIGKTNILQKLMQENITLPPKVWSKLNLSWAGFFTGIGWLNMYIINNYSTDFWVNFKLFGVLGLTIFFGIVQAMFLTKYVNKL